MTTDVDRVPHTIGYVATHFGRERCVCWKKRELFERHDLTLPIRWALSQRFRFIVRHSIEVAFKEVETGIYLCHRL